ncbi:hypothetical protein PR048_026571 [Dryococelus australis]|uniref:nitric-oxide synthase (NADPH) n=1 Tax=Dryococelus australis TaxID=614101 RepID=A0ABQ9GLQ2_9NEOP|nr:hypothetical protein PR048_026571 [Dryococelus australis]
MYLTGHWSVLQVFDCRCVTTTSGMFEAICNHIKYSTNKGNIRSAITVFPQRKDGAHDFRVWNPQLLNYAGYKQPNGTILGDPNSVEFTEVCTKLGWRGHGTSWDILPLVLSANGDDPDFFDIPPDLVLQLPLTHPKYDWFEELNLRWYTVPAVSGMLFDCGGIEFPAAPFNGWYMSTEIGRNLCDPHRYNVLENVAVRLGLDTRTSVSLWKDRALVEVNLAVLHSFQACNVTIVDHHTAAESFMKHYENEMKLRRGCPADWVWIVPPMSASLTPVFHQEMALYQLKPSYEYQGAVWKSHVWKTGTDSLIAKKPRKKFRFKQIARAVKFTSKLFGHALSRRIKATVLYATETGKSELYAKKLGEIFAHAFNSQVYCMDDYDISSIEHEALILVVTSTFGNGDPPENGVSFAQNLYAMKMNENEDMVNGSNHKFSMASSKSFIKANSQSELGSRTLDRLDSLRGSGSDVMVEDTFGPLSNVRGLCVCVCGDRFAVFALGSSAYPNFCAFGKYVDNLLGELGGERLLKMLQGDEMLGQDQAFRNWAPDVFTTACETFCLDDDETIKEATKALKVPTLSTSTVRFVEAKVQPLAQALSKCHNKDIAAFKALGKKHLHGNNASRTTIRVEVASSLEYQPGDHVGVLAANSRELVDGVLARLQTTFDLDCPVQLQLQKDTRTPNGVVKTWERHCRLPPCSLRTLFTRFLDITTPPTPDLLQQLAAAATDPEDNRRLIKLVTEPASYEDWRHWHMPHLLEVLEQFPSVRPSAALLATQLSPLQPRFYSISSSPKVHPGQIHLTVAVVIYNTQGGKGPKHYGVCSNYLSDLNINDDIHMFVRSAPSFHLPADISKPIIMVGPGTGVAPFRGFWHHRKYNMESAPQGGQKMGSMWLFFGCREKSLNLYRVEKEVALREGVLDKTFLALSRQQSLPKMYVQDLMKREGADVYRKVVAEQGHFYVCGDCTMAENVYQTLKQIIQEHSNMTDNEVETYMLKLRDESRYHEDIFGIVLRTAEVHDRCRESARIRMAARP